MIFQLLVDFLQKIDQFCSGRTVIVEMVTDIFIASDVDPHFKRGISFIEPDVCITN